AFSCVWYWNSSPTCWARQMRLVPTSSPNAVLLAFSLFDIVFLLCVICPGFHPVGCGDLEVFQLQQCPVAPNRQTQPSRLGTNLVFGVQQPGQQASTGGLHVV